MYAIVILWDSSKKYFEQIINDISTVATIEKIKPIKMFKEYSNFIVDMYEFNNQKELGIYKASKMYKGDVDHDIMILKIRFDNKEFETYELIKQMKKHIRDKYKSFVDCYFHDNIIHTTDCFEEVEHVTKVLKTYRCKL